MTVRIVRVNNPIEILILGHREALKNAMAKSFEKLGIGDVAKFEEQENIGFYHQGAIKALETSMKGI